MTQQAISELQKKVKDLMAGRGQSALAADLGVDQSSISRFLSGKNKPTRRLAMALVRKYPWLKPDLEAIIFGSDMRIPHDDDASECQSA